MTATELIWGRLMCYFQLFVVGIVARGAEAFEVGTGRSESTSKQTEGFVHLADYYVRMFANSLVVERKLLALMSYVTTHSVVVRNATTNSHHFTLF